ncbi:hypothetical protein E4T43_02595 [Aureobasidium subglaciale]|nr:hypothetical protein E4T43_02595 [Aureobasidium subglaciale]
MADQANEGGRELDLEKELSCSICTDVLYRPLTLLDCLHTFCGSCLREWFAWQASSKGHVYSCPACRAAVRDTRPNATLTTLLEMFLQAHPDKGKTAQEKLDMDKTYKPGDDVIPPMDLGQVSDDDDDEEERRMLAQARELSLNDVGLGSRSTQRPNQRQTNLPRPRRHADSPQSGQADGLSHQSSIRSLLSQSDVDLGDMEDEIMRHIIDHGLLDGMDLNNLTPDQEDAITDSIAQAYRSRRRQDRRDRDRNRERSAAHHSPAIQTHRHTPRSSTTRHSPSTSTHRQPTSTATTRSSHALAPTQNQPSPARRRAASANHTHRLNTASDRPRHLVPDSPSRPSNHSSPALPISAREEPSSDVLAPPVACSRCEKPDIQHSLHYNCDKCSDGNFNLCIECYRTGKGCLNWYGFGHTAMTRYRPQAASRSEHADHGVPHVLSARRYVQNPTRLEQGLFCDGCQAFADACYWHCNSCNDGAWGFCNACVEQGKHCSHPLASVAHLSQAPTPSQRRSPTDLYPSSLTSTGSAFHFAVPSSHTPTLPHVSDPASYVPIVLTSYCVICQYSVPPSHARFHCNTCNEGNYDICNSCYHSLVNTGKIARTNGPSGWRRCLRSHRMSVVGHEDREGGPHRIVVREIVGGWALKDDISATPTSTLTSAITQQDQWRWKEDDGTSMATTSTSKFPGSPHLLPPDGGIGLRAQAIWSYFPSDDTKDELRFPRNALITEVEDINGDWFWGVYCGGKGLFPGNYVRIV